MKKRVFLFIALCFSILSHAQRNYAQELVDLLHQERYFDAREFKKQYANQLPQKDKALNLMYNLHISLAFNKPDSAVAYFEEFLGNQDYVRILGPVVASYYSRLSGVYEDKQQFELSISTIERHINYLKENPYSLDPQLIKNEIHEAQAKISSLKEKANEPKRRIRRDSDTGGMKLKDGVHIRFDAQYNGKTIETFFDTGTIHYFFIERGLADDIGVKYKPNQDMELQNGNHVKLLEGIIDSVELKGVKLYNIPVAVFNEKFSSNLPDKLEADHKKDIKKHFLKERQIIMGLPTMKMIGRFQFDWESNVLYIPPKQESVEISTTSNLMFLKNTPYLNIKIGDMGFTGFFDTGSDHFLYLTYPYLRSKSDFLELEDQKELFTRTGFTGINENIERQRVKNPHIYFDGRKICSGDSDCEVYAVDMVWAKINNFDGEVGVKLIRNISPKILVDFDAMTIKSEN